MSLDRLMTRIYTKPTDYKFRKAWVYNGKNGYREDPKLWEVMLVPEPRKIAFFKSEEECQAFIDSRVNPPVVKPRIYSDICRCGMHQEGEPKVWKYLQCEELIFEVCPWCHLPMRHDVLVELNRSQIQDFDLDAFIQGL